MISPFHLPVLIQLTFMQFVVQLKSAHFFLTQNRFSNMGPPKLFSSCHSSCQFLMGSLLVSAPTAYPAYPVPIRLMPERPMRISWVCLQRSLADSGASTFGRGPLPFATTALRFLLPMRLPYPP